MVTHCSFLWDLAHIQDVLQEYLLEDNLQMEELQANYAVDLSLVPDNVRNHLGVQEAVTHVEFRENQLCEILGLLYQLEGTVPDSVMEQLTC